MKKWRPVAPVFEDEPDLDRSRARSRMAFFEFPKTLPPAHQDGVPAINHFTASAPVGASAIRRYHRYVTAGGRWCAGDKKTRCIGNRSSGRTRSFSCEGAQFLHGAHRWAGRHVSMCMQLCCHCVRSTRSRAWASKTTHETTPGQCPRGRTLQENQQADHPCDQCVHDPRQRDNPARIQCLIRLLWNLFFTCIFIF
jgi:hypothetical protein